MTAGRTDGAPADVRAHLAGAREPRAAGPAPDAESLRRAYLDLLKLALCDLAGTSTVSRRRACRTARSCRASCAATSGGCASAGMDWPLPGLDDDRPRPARRPAGVRGVRRRGRRSPGDVDRGRARGAAARRSSCAPTLDALGDDRTVWVADSFQGFPAGEAPPGGRLSAFDFLAAPLEEVREHFARFGCERGVRVRARLLRGHAARPRRPALVDRPPRRRHLRADARSALARLYPGLAPGGHLIVDDYGSFQGCRRRSTSSAPSTGSPSRSSGSTPPCVRWRRADEADVPGRRSHASRGRRAAATRAARPEVPTARELALADELAALRARLAAAERALAGLRARRRGAAPARGCGAGSRAGAMIVFGVLDHRPRGLRALPPSRASAWPPSPTPR